MHKKQLLYLWTDSKKWFMILSVFKCKVTKEVGLSLQHPNVFSQCGHTHCSFKPLNAWKTFKECKRKRETWFSFCWYLFNTGSFSKIVPYIWRKPVKVSDNHDRCNVVLRNTIDWTEVPIVWFRQARSISFLWEFVRHAQVVGPHFRPNESETLIWSPTNCILKSHSGDSRACQNLWTISFEDLTCYHWLRVVTV